ncbi:hypothetical protein BWI15_33925 [Kribbella sp. ALI-6-A]|uniref:hypothetical protein n=1 Tax=Kribbella sp. ALI-6-A TaxID=1933817 RepID=UPI00097C3BC5|nr:hypothetical protein [Kribbella sp. ALI-6-A]ONI68049.1 hypothetical protein BWI15_33925 [Kribbella sp. ALI-6-A]
MRFRSRAAAAVAALPLILGATACGAGSNDSAVTATTDSMPTPVVTPSVTPSAAPQKVVPAPVRLNRVTFLPAMNTALAKQKSYRITGRMTAGGEVLMTTTGVQQTTPPAMSMSMTGVAFGGKTAKIVLVGKTLYMSLPGATPTGKYVKIDSSDPSMAQFGELAGSGDPTKTFKSFKGALRGVKFVKSETIGGVKLDRYAVTVDAAAALKAQGKKVPAGVPTTVTYSMWMDDDKMARRFSFDLMGMSMVMTMDPTTAPVAIKAPAAKNVVN